MVVPVSLVSPYCSCLQWPLLCYDTRSICSTEQENTIQHLLHSIKMFSYLSFLSRLCNWIPSFSIFMAAKGWGWGMGGGNDSKYLIKIKCYDLISAERILSHLYESFERVPKPMAQSDCGPVIPSGYWKALRNSRYHEIRKIKITVCTNCMEDREETICEQWQD